MSQALVSLSSKEDACCSAKEKTGCPASSSGCMLSVQASACHLVARFHHILGLLQSVDFSLESSGKVASELYLDLKEALYQVECSECKLEVVQLLKKSEIVSCLRPLAQVAEEAHERMVAQVIYG